MKARAITAPSSSGTPLPVNAARKPVARFCLPQARTNSAQEIATSAPIAANKSTSETNVCHPIDHAKRFRFLRCEIIVRLVCERDLRVRVLDAHPFPVADLPELSEAAWLTRQR
jgi:hypothetical protein